MCLLTGETDGAALELAFSKKKIEERKAWLQGYVPGTYLDMSQDLISYHDFVNKARSLPFSLSSLSIGSKR